MGVSVGYYTRKNLATRRQSVCQKVRVGEVYLKGSHR